MKIAVSAESTCDLSKSLLEEFDISVIPYIIILGDKEYKDGEITPEKIFEYVDKTGELPKTCALNEFTYLEYFESLKKEYDAVIHICLSSGITSSCGNAENAAKKTDNVFVVDSKSLSTGIGLLCIYARELSKTESDPAKISEAVKARAEKLQVSFVIERLDYLYKGGRCNGLQLLGANFLKLRPKIILKDGKMSSDKKYRGNMDFAVQKYCEDVVSEHSRPSKELGFITYTSATEQMVGNAEKAMKDAGFLRIEKTFAGATISSHCGANTLGILFFDE